MRCAVWAVGLLLAIATGCANRPAAAGQADLDGLPAAGQASPDAADGAASPPGDMTAAKRQEEIQGLLDSRQRERAALEVLAANAAVRAERGGIVVTLSCGVLFAPEEAALLPSAQGTMQKIAGALLVTKEREMLVEGHTDSSGTTGGNLELSRQRAEAVRTYLVAQGYPAARIRAQGIGQEHPVATNASGAKVSEQRYLPYGGTRSRSMPTDRQLPGKGDIDSN